MDFIEKDDGLRAEGNKKHPQFRAVLDDIAAHQNREYWIYKTAIPNNLCDVD